MPHSLRAQIKTLCYKGMLTEKERDRVIKALDIADSAESNQTELKSSYNSVKTELDVISRQAAIDAIRASTSKYTGFMEMEMYTDDDAVEAIEGLPGLDI